MSAFSELNPEQIAAVKSCRHQPLVVLAGPGSGKTTTLIRRCVWIEGELQRCGGAKFNVTFLIVTFSKNSSLEMDDRLRRLAGQAQALTARIEVSTYHSFSYKLIMKHWTKLGFERCPNFCSNRDSFRYMKVMLFGEPLTTSIITISIVLISIRKP
jgi:superfamily I DNA/RNA helicase